jgi:tetratricopeptide (TPR) repeat protein
MRIVLAICLAILSVPLAFADDRIWLENTTIDGKAVKMLFDTGSDSIALTSQAVKRLGLKIVAPATNRLGETAVYSGEIEGQPFQMDFGILSFPYLIPDFDGLMGWGPLHSGIFRIDAEARKLTPFPEVPAGIKLWPQLLIDTNAGTLNLEIPGKHKGQNVITIDTGDPCGINLTAREWKRWKKAHPRNSITLRNYVTADGMYIGEESWADQIQTGPLTLYDVPVMEEGPSTRIEFGSERDILGLAALRRLDLVVDGIHGVAYLRVKQTQPPPYSYNRLGTEFIPTATDSNDLVAQVVTGSPGYEAGIRNGDILLKVDGQSVSGWTNGMNESDTNAFSMPAGTKLQLTLRRNKKVFETTAVLREILQPSHRKYDSTEDFPGRSDLDAESYYSQGMECEIRGDSNGALTNYDRAIEIDPDFGDAYGRRAYLEQSDSNLDATLADYNKAINLGSATASDYANRGMVEQRKGDLAAALADYNKAIELQPDLAEVYACRGSLEQRRNEFDAAIEDYRKALELKVALPGMKSTLAQLYAYRGDLEMRTNQLDVALADLNKAIAFESDLAQAYADRGWLEQQKREFSAIADYEKALQLNPDLSDAKSYLAQSYASRGYQKMRTNQLDALADLNKAIGLEPDLAEAYVDRGWVEEQTNEPGAALADYEKALRFKPDLADTKSHLAQIYGYRGDREMRTNQADAALADFSRAIALEPGLAQAYVDRGWLEQQKGNLNAALGDYTRAIDLTPESESAGIYANRGYLEQAMGKIEAALADDDRAVQLDPRSAELYGNRSGVEETKGDLDRSEADCAEAARLDPKMAMTAAQQFRDLGESRFERREYTNALTDYRKACELKPTDDYAHFDIWLCSSSLRNSERANTDLKAYLSARGSKDPGDWPSEVGWFLVGQITEQDLLRAAKSADIKKDKEQHCEAYYYIGSKRLFAGDKTIAAAEFGNCLATDVTNWVEYQFAQAQLEVLKTNGASP